MKFERTCIMVAVLACIHGVALAQNEAAASAKADQAAQAAESEVLAETVITATRTATKVDETPGASYVVTQQQMQKRNIKTLDETVNTIPGVFNSRTKGMMDTRSSITTRGIPGQDRTLIMLDGIPLNSGYTGEVSYGGLAAEDMARVEVALGPGSSLYGSNAMGGVINYMTAMPKKREFRFKLGYGDGLGTDIAMRNLKRSYVSFGDKFDSGLSLFASVSAVGTTGYPGTWAMTYTKPAAGLTGYQTTTAVNDATRPRYIIGTQGNNHWKENSVNLRAAMDLPQNGELRFGYLRNQYEYDYGHPETFVRNAAGQSVWRNWPTPQSFRESNFLTSGGSGKGVNNLLYGNLEMALGTGRLRVNAGVQRSKPDWYILPTSGNTTTRNGGPGTMSERPSRLAYADAQYTFSPSSRHVVVVGAALRTEKADTTDYTLSDWRSDKAKSGITRTSSGKTRTIGLFVQDEIAVTDQFTASLGLRWDHWKNRKGEIDADGPGPILPQQYGSRTHSALSPKLGLRYRLNDKVSLRSSLGKAFRAPNVYELYRNWSSGTSLYRPNPNLKPETAVSWDIGADFHPWQGADVKATFYYNRLKNMIYRQQVGVDGAGRKVQEFINVGRGRSYGLELDMRQKIDQNWTLLANAVYNNTRIQEHADPLIVGKRFIMVPKYTANLGVEWKRGPWDASGWVRHASRRYNTDDNSDTVNGVPGSHDRYTLVDLKAGYQINKHLKASVSVDNLFNKKYYGGSYRTPGRSYFVELAGNF